MKTRLPLLLLVGMAYSLPIGAQNESYFETEENKPYEINKYRGPESTKEIIVPTTINNTKITRISGLVGDSLNWPYLENIYIPSGIEITGALGTNQASIKCVAIDASINRLYNTSVLKYSSSNIDLNTVSLQSIFSFSKVSNLSYLAGPESNNNNYIHYIGEVSFQLKNNETSEICYVYNWSYYNTDKMVEFGQTRYELLIWTLKQHLEHKNCSINDISIINLSQLTQPYKKNAIKITFDDNFNPASLLNPGATVIVDENTRYTSSTLQDLTDYSAPAEDITNVIQYNRNDTKGWNSVCLPFDISEQDFPSEYDAKIYTISGAEENSILLSRVTEAIPAGTPCFVSTDAENWNLSLTERTISKDVKLNPQRVGDWQMVGSFTTQVIGEGKYKITADGKNISKTQSADSKTFPFRCYLENNAPNGAPMRLDVNIENEEAITLIPDDAEPVTLTVYDLMGRPSTHQSLPHIQNGHKQIIR